MLILESSCSTFTEQETASDSSSSSLPQLEDMGGVFSGMGFGSFGPDRGEQRAWRARIVLKDIRQVSELWKRIRTFVAQERAGSMSVLHDEPCHDQLSTRLNALALRLEKVQNLC